MTAGNHEFDFGTEQFLANAAAAKFPILAANVLRNGQPLLKGVQNGNNGNHTIIERNGVKIGFFGLTTADTATSANPAGIADLTFMNEIEVAKREIAELEEKGADVIIAVCHLGTTDASCTSTKLAEATEGKIHVIIDGHSHTTENDDSTGTLIVQTGSGMAALGKLTLTINGDEVTAEEELLTWNDVALITPDTEVAAKLDEIDASSAELLKESVADTETTLWAGNIGGGVAIPRLVETNYGDFVADAFRNAAEAMMQNSDGEDAGLPIIAVENGGGIRAGAGNGTITMGDLISAFPFSNPLYLKKVTPSILYEVMEVSGKKLDGQDKETGMLLQETNSGGFLQISGFTVVYDPDGAEGQKVVSITLDGQREPLRRDDTTTEIMMIGNNYIMSGGSDYTMLGELPKYAEAGGELETIQSYMESCLENGTLQGYAGTKNRIQMRSEGYVPKDYTVSVLITDEEGQPLPNKPLSYRIDGGARQNGTTDENGMLRITLTDGAHGVRLADTQQEVYIDNYSGFGIVEDQYRTPVTLTFLSDGSCDPVEDKDETSEENPDTGDELPAVFAVVMTGCMAVLLVLPRIKKRTWQKTV